MAKIFTFLCVAFISFSALVLQVESQDKIVETDELDPVQQVQVTVETGTEAGDGKERDKRFFPLKKIGVKAGLVHLLFGKIDSFIDSKTRYINELDKQNIIKNQKYFGITQPPPTPPNNLVNNLIGIKKNLLGQAVSSFIQAKIGQASGSLGLGSSSDDGDSDNGGALASLFQLSAGILPALSGGGSGGNGDGGSTASFGASASLPGVGSASFGADSGSGGASFGASAGLGTSFSASASGSSGYN